MYCPYCFASLDERVLVCRNERCELFEQTMPQRAPRLLTRLPDRLRIRGGSFMADRNVACDACGQSCLTICEACGRDVSATWTRYPQRSVMFLGVNGVGKSTLLATAKMSLSRRSDLILTPMDVENTAERFYDRYAQPLLERNDSVPHTPAELPEPFLWGVTCRSGARASTLALAVYDVPGEMLVRHSAVAPIEAMLSGTDAAVLVINPASLPALHGRCGEQAGVALAADAWERAERILDELLKYRSIGQKCPLSVAVVFTHLDVWFAALSDCASTEALTDAYLRRLMQSWRGDSLLTRLNEFRCSRLFATGLYRGEDFRPLAGADAPLAFLLKDFGLPVSVRLR